MTWDTVDSSDSSTRVERHGFLSSRWYTSFPVPKASIMMSFMVNHVSAARIARRDPRQEEESVKKSFIVSVAVLLLAGAALVACVAEEQQISIDQISDVDDTAATVRSRTLPTETVRTDTPASATTATTATATDP